MSNYTSTNYTTLSTREGVENDNGNANAIIIGVGSASAPAAMHHAHAAAAGTTTGNATPTSLDSQDSDNSGMDGIEWDDESDDEENLGLLFWDELPPGDNAVSSTTNSGDIDVSGMAGDGRGGGGCEGGGGVGNNNVDESNGGGGDDENEIPIIHPQDQSVEYMGEELLFGMQNQHQQHQQHGSVVVVHGTNHSSAGSDAAAAQIFIVDDSVLRRTSPGSTLEHLIVNSIPNVGLPSREEAGGGDASPSYHVVAPSTNNTMGNGGGGGAAPTTTMVGTNSATEMSPVFPSPSCGSGPSLLEVQEAQQQQQQALGIVSAFKAAAASGVGGGGGISNSNSGMLPSSHHTASSSGNVQVPVMNTTNVNDQWSIHQLQQMAQQQQQQQQQLSSAMSPHPPPQAPNQPPLLGAPTLGVVAPTSPHPYMMWLLQQQQQAQQLAHVAQQQANVVVPQGQAQTLLHALQGQGKCNQEADNSSAMTAPSPASNNNAAAATTSSNSSAAQMTLNQFQLFQFLQLQQQQQLQTAASQQQQHQQQSNIMQVSAEQLHSMQRQVHQQQQSVNNMAVATSGTSQGWMGNPLSQQQQQQQENQAPQPQLNSHTPSLQAATQQSQGPIKEGKRMRTVASAKDSTNYKRKRPNQKQAQRKERPQSKSKYAAAAATVAHTPPGGGGGGKQSTSQYNDGLLNSVAPTETLTIPNAAPTNAVTATNSMPLVSASDTEGGGQLEWLSDHSQNQVTRIGSISPNYFYTSAEECSGTEEHLKFATEEQRIQYNRERNREHAKNTRIRKKAFVEQLKLSVDELCRERDSLISERAMAANLMVETHSKRVDVLRSVFALRAGYGFDQKRELWSSILDESSFTCRLPVTPYQSFPSSEVQVSNCQRTIVGVDAMISDAASNYVFLDSIVDRAQYPDGKIKFQYTLVTEESVVAGNQLMARWAMSTLNAKKLGANTELHQSGMLICKFNTAHKIVALEIMFDVMAFMLQVKMAMGFDNFNDVVIPNTVQTCSQKVYDYPMVMTLASRPYTIVQVNDRWEKLTGYSRHEVVGKRSCSILQGRFHHHGSSATRNNADVEEENRKELDKLMGPLMFQRPSCAMLTNYTKFGRRYRQYVTLYPLSTDSNIQHYFGLTTFVQWMDDEDDVGAVVAGECNNRTSNNYGGPSSMYSNDDGTDRKQRPSLGAEGATTHNTTTKMSSSSDNSRSSSGGHSSTSPSASSLPQPASSSSSSAAVPAAAAGKTGMSNSHCEKQSSTSLTSSMSNTSSDDVCIMEADQ